MAIDIHGAWLSKGKLIYVITQIEDKFTWRVIHKNGITETGIGEFTEKDAVSAKWNFHEGGQEKPFKLDSGKVVSINNKAIKIEWNDSDHFIQRVP